MGTFLGGDGLWDQAMGWGRLGKVPLAPRSRLCVGFQLAPTSRARTGVRRTWVAEGSGE